MDKTNRIKSLDAFRGIAALSVVLYHYTSRYSDIFDSSYPISFSLGWLGVPVFFILSGFVIHLTIDRSKTATEFFLKRFLRLYPTFWLSIIITLLFVYLSNFQPRPNYSLSLMDIVMNLTMWHEFFGFNHIDGAYWSLLPELLFYVLMATLLWAKLLNRFYFINIFLIIIGTVHYFFPIWIIGKLLDLDYVLLFFIGICFYRLKNNKFLKIEHLLIVVNLIVASFLYQRVQPSNDIKLILIAFTIIVFIYYCFLYGKLNWLGKSKLLIFLGNISYALYLVHQNMGYVIIRYFEVNFNGRTLGMFIALFFSIIVAYTLTYKIEPVFRNKLSKLSFLSLNKAN